MTRRRWLGEAFLAPGLIWLVLLFLVPLGLVVAMSLGTTDVVGRPVYGWHPGNYGQVFQPIFLPILLRSLVYALTVTLVCLILGYSVAYTVAMYGGRFRNALILLVVLPWFVDYLVRIYAWVELLAQGGLISDALRSIGVGGRLGLQLSGNTASVVVGLIYNTLPFMILPVYVAVEQIDRQLIESGRDLYGTARQTFFRVTFPVTMQGVVAGSVLVFLTAVGDFATAQLLGSPANYMIGNLIQDEFSGSASLPLGAGLTVLLMALLGVLVIIYMRAGSARSTSVPR